MITTIMTITMLSYFEMEDAGHEMKRERRYSEKAEQDEKWTIHTNKKFSIIDGKV